MERLDIPVYCSNCKNATNHDIVKKFEQESLPGNYMRWEQSFYITMCAGCESVAFVHVYSDQDMYEYDGDNIYPYSEVEVYPPEPIEEPEEDLFTAKIFRNSSEIVDDLYYEIIGAYNSGYPTLATMGLRTIIEAICTDINIKKGYRYDTVRNKLPDRDGVIRKVDNIEGKINGLYENGLIIWEQALVLQKVRKIGNNAAHSAEVVTVGTFRSAIQIIEHLIVNVYELKHHKLLKEQE